jgi:hypothetical protein
MDGEVAQANPGRRENGIADGGCDDRRAFAMVAVRMG